MSRTNNLKIHPPTSRNHASVARRSKSRKSLHESRWRSTTFTQCNARFQLILLKLFLIFYSIKN